MIATGVMLGVGLTGPALARPDDGAGTTEGKARPGAPRSVATKNTVDRTTGDGSTTGKAGTKTGTKAGTKATDRAGDTAGDRAGKTTKRKPVRTDGTTGTGKTGGNGKSTGNTRNNDKGRTDGGKSSPTSGPAEGKRSGTDAKKASGSAKAGSVRGWAKVMGPGDPTAPAGAVASPAATPTTEATPDPDNSSPAATEPVITEITEGDKQLIVKWTAPSSGTPTGYTVWAGGDVRDPDCEDLQPNVLQCTVKGLENEVSYAVEVAANHGTDDPTISQAWWATPHTTPIDPPGTPTLDDIVVDGNKLTLTWNEPADGGAAIIGYKIVAKHGNEVVPCVQPAGRTSTTCTITGTSGVEYAATVAAWNSEGVGTASAEKKATAASSVPGAPTVKAELSGTTVTVTAASADTGGTALDGYEIAVTKVGGGTVVECAGTKTPQPPVLYTTGICTFEGVQGESYSVKARAHNAQGYSAMTTVTRMMAPAAPTVSMTVKGRDVTVSWTPQGTGGAPVQGYQVAVNREGQQGSVTCTGQMGSGDTAGLHTGTSCTFTGVPGSEYTASVKAKNSVGMSAIAGSDMETVPALAGPTGLKAEPGNAEATVTWTPITPTTGITGYVVTYAKEGGQPQTAQVQGADKGTHTLTGLVNGDTYMVMVKAVLSEGTATDTEAVKVTPSAPPAIPQDGPPAPDGALTAPAGATSPDPGESITISGSGFAPNSEVTIVIYSTPQNLGTVVTDQAGAFSRAVTIPTGLSGSHTITTFGVDPDGAARVLSLGVTVAGTTSNTGGSGGSGGGGSSGCCGGLAITGAPIVTILLTGILLIASGAVSQFVGRRPGRRRGVHRAPVSREELEAAQR